MTTQSKSNYREKGRAVFLSAIMVLSMVAVGAAFTGSAAAVNIDDASEFNQVEGNNGQYYVSDDKADLNFSTYGDLSGGNVYQGQEVSVNVSDNVEEDSYELRRIDSFGDTEGSTSLAQEITSDDDGVVTFDTSDQAAGDYFLTNGSNVASTPNVTEALDNRGDTFGIVEQSLTATFSEDDVTDEGENANDNEFEFDSNRGTYPVTVHANGDLDTDDLTNIFVNNSDPQPEGVPEIRKDYEEEGDDGETDFDEIGLVVNGSSGNLAGVQDSEDYNVDFTGIDTGSYEFTFVGTDSEATTTDSIEVTEADESASFAEGTTQTGAGDIASFELDLQDTDDAYVQIGGESEDFADVLYVEVDDAAEPVTVDINTRLLGTNTSDTDSVYDTDNTDTFLSSVHDNATDVRDEVSGVELYEDDGTDDGESLTFPEYLDAMDIINEDAGENGTDQLLRPLQTTDYNIVAAGTQDVDFVFDADAGGEANDELGSKVLQLTQPTIGEITTHTAPENNANDKDNVTALVDAATPRDAVALDDQLVVQVEATGIFGSLVAIDAENSDEGDLAINSDFDRLDDGVSTQVMNQLEQNSSEQITFEVTADGTTGNQDALEVDLNASDSDSFIVLDQENEQFFLVVDTSSDSAFENGDAPDESTSFTAELEYDADNEDDRFEFGDGSGPFEVADTNFQNYPYLQQGETIGNTETVTLEQREILFDSLNSDQVVEVAASESAEVTGNTNVAPGSDASIRVQSTEASSSFRIGNDVNITDDGTVTTTYDLSDQEIGDEFSLDYRVEGSSADSANGVLVESVDTGTDEPADDSETEEPADDGDGSADDGDGSADDGDGSADDGDMASDDGSADDGGSTDDGTPGFGAVVALVALIGAALLAVRRQN